MEKKKILHIVEAFGGGIFSFLVDLVNSTEDDFEIVIAYGLRKQTPEDFESYFGNKVKFIKVENFTRSINLIKDIKALLEIKHIIKKEKPDIVHLHSSKAGILGRLATNCKKTKVLYNPHGFSFLMQNSSVIKRKVYWWLEKIFSIKKATIVGCSYGEYEEAFKLTKNSICISNGINIKKLKGETEKLEKKSVDFSNLKICTSGRIGFQKNPKLFNEIAKAFPNFKFTWIGEGELREELTSSNIEVTGWKTRSEVLKLVNDNDIFILTSLWEGLPISLLEAMYLEKLCIVTDCIGNRDAIKNEVNGFIIKEDNYKDIIENIKEDIYNKLSKSAKESILTEFNTEKMAEEYRKVYNK